MKGSPPQKEALAWLRNLEIISAGGGHYFAPTERDGLFEPGHRYVLFLVKTERGDDTPYENVNCQGSSFPISPLRDLDSLKVDSLPDTLILLCREYVDYKRSELKQLEKELDAFIHEGDK